MPYLSTLQIARSARCLRDVNAMHQITMSAFDDTGARAERGVLWRLDGCRLTVQSDDAPDWRRVADGVVQDATVRQVDHTYAAGDELQFTLRANPTRRIKRDSGGSTRVPVRGHAARLAWLERKAGDHGFRLITAREIEEPATSSRRGVTFGSAVFAGRLVVVDADAFSAALRSGIGPGKAFGFGLLTADATH